MLRETAENLRATATVSMLNVKFMTVLNRTYLLISKKNVAAQIRFAKF